MSDIFAGRAIDAEVGDEFVYLASDRSVQGWRVIRMSGILNDFAHWEEEDTLVVFSLVADPYVALKPCSNCGVTQIEERFRQGDQRHYFVCLGCGIARSMPPLRQRTAWAPSEAKAIMRREGSGGKDESQNGIQESDQGAEQG